MIRKFAELENKMSPESRARSDAIYCQLLAELPLAELRRARGLSQKTLAGVLHVDQASISKMERRTDMYISTLRSHIEAMGANWRSSHVSPMVRSKSLTLMVSNLNRQ